MKVHVWVPNYVSATGGIQALSRFLVRALRECLPDAEIVVLSKNDRSVPDPGENTVTQFSAVGWWAPSQRTAAFTINLLRWAVRERPDLIIATHVNFTPAAGNKDGSVDAVINGKLGVPVDPDNVAEIAEALVLILTKMHPLGILQDPQRLRAEVIAAYGYARLVEVLATHLAYCGFSPKGAR
jgi:hypothetical protein